MPQQLEIPPSGAGTAESVDSDSIDPDPAVELPAIPMPSRSEFVRYWSELCDREGESRAAAQPIAEPIEPAPFSGFPLPTGNEEFAYWRMPAASEALGYWRGLWGSEAPASESPAVAQPLAATHPMAEQGQGEPIVVPVAGVEEYTVEEDEPVARMVHGSCRRLAAELLKDFLHFEPVEYRKILRGATVMVRMRNGEKPDCECGGPDGCVLHRESGKLFWRLPDDAAPALKTLDILAGLLRFVEDGTDISDARKYVRVVGRTKVRPGHLRLVGVED